LANVTVNGGTVTALAGTHSNLPAVTLSGVNGGNIGATGPGNAPTGPTINYILDGNVNTVPGGKIPTINAPAILLRHGTNTPVTFTIPRGTAPSDLVIASVIHDGGGGLIKNGDGILTLSGVNTYTGPTVISAGRVEANGASTLGGSAVTLNGGGVLSIGSPPTFAGFGNVTLNGGASVTDDILTLTTDVGNQARSAFTNTRYAVGDGFLRQLRL
jgi:autotransporter-associated beta strand protein